MLGELGDKVSPFQVEKLTLATGQKLTAGILSKKIRIVKVHYRKGIGYVHCFEGSCCDVMGIPGVRYVFPLAVYPCDLQGELIKPVSELTLDDIVVRSLVLGKDDYENILTKNQLQMRAGKDITRVDLLITCTDQEFQKKDYDVAGDAIWRQVFDKESYVAALTIFHNKAEEALGRTVDAQGFEKLLLHAAEAAPVIDRPVAGANQQKLPVKTETIDFDDMFDTDRSPSQDTEQSVIVEDGPDTEPEDIDDIPF